MSYKLIIPKKVQKEVDKIDENYRIRILATLKSLEENPYLGKKLEGKLKEQRSYDVRPYRIIYEIRKEQLLKFSLLPLALRVIKNSGTIQEHRKGIIAIGKVGKDGLKKTKNVEYWAFVAIIGDSEIKIRVILRRVGDGNIIFWSVMPDSNLKKGQKLYTEGIEYE